MVVRVLLGACVCWLFLAGCNKFEAARSAQASSQTHGYRSSSSGLFSKRGYAQAKGDADASGRLFVVDATASWCPPCKFMDKTTWKDPRVISWVRDHAVAVQLDVDRDPKRARALRIRAMPTIVVFKAGREVDRVVGYRTADQMLGWLDRVRARAGTS